MTYERLTIHNLYRFLPTFREVCTRGDHSVRLRETLLSVCMSLYSMSASVVYSTYHHGSFNVSRDRTPLLLPPNFRPRRGSLYGVTDTCPSGVHPCTSTGRGCGLDQDKGLGLKKSNSLVVGVEQVVTQEPVTEEDSPGVRRRQTYVRCLLLSEGESQGEVSQREGGLLGVGRRRGPRGSGV